MSHPGRLTRRSMLRASAAALGASWVPIGILTPALAGADVPAPPGFPPDMDLHREVYENWAGEIRADDVWTCVPRSPADVVAVVNWAYQHGWTARPRGYRHGWAPLTVTPSSDDAAATVLVDTTRHLTGIEVVSAAPAAVRVQTGASMDALLAFLERAAGRANAPAPGDLSVGGVLAIDGHGASLPAAGETRMPGHTYGTLSNLILSLTAVVWDAAAGRYALRTFQRGEPDCKAFLTHVGRALLTEVTLRVGADYNLRCVSRVDIPASELFAAPGSGATRTFASLVEGAGRVEAIWFTFTTHPWVKIWSVSPTRPLTSRPVVAPYNYAFSDNVPEPVSDLAWRPSYDPLLEIQAGWARGPDRDLIAWVSALTSDMVFTQPVVYELADLRVPALLIIGQRDRTAIGKDQAPPEVARTLGDYPALGRRAAAAIPGAQLVELDGVGHVPQVEAFDLTIAALRAFLAGGGAGRPAHDRR